MMPTLPATIGLLRYNAGNSGSVARALQRLGITFKTVESAGDFQSISGLIFPGAGAAGAAMRDLASRNLIEPLRAFKKPFLGLCLGMQLLFDFSEEDGGVDCLGIMKGAVRALPYAVVRPHMGWNKLSTGEYVYFVHSFVCVPKEKSAITMTVQYGEALCAGVRKGNFAGVQWHPEKSGKAGDDLLLSFFSSCK